MELSSGTRLGPYEVLSRLGQGGMGEVWRARDTRLGRSVAIKVLPSDLAGNGELRQRFEREARTISQLNHPHICTLHDVGDGYLVMELLEGETLADRLVRGPLSVDDVVKYGMQIADALDKAHRRGIVHRDLKPGNIMITPSGAKLLDFGLAKPAAVGLSDNDATAQKPLTSEGVILGTFQYMAPEQLEGAEADARTDIFAFGTVLYEMATGRRAFGGKTRTSLIAAIVGGEPEPISQLRPVAPRSLDRVVSRCLRKDPEERWQNARDVAFELAAVLEREADDSRAPAVSRRKLAGAAVLFTVLGILAGAAATRLLMPRANDRTERLSMVTPPGIAFERMLSISPDGSTVVFRGADAAGRIQLYIRKIEAPSAEAIRGAEGGRHPFWSPDGKHLAFFAGSKLMRLDLRNGNVQPICDAAFGGGGSWAHDGTIIFASSLEGALSRVSADGGSPAALTTLRRGEQFHLWPHFLPDGKRYLYAVGGEAGKRGIFAGELGTDERRLIAPAPDYQDITMAAYAAGRLYFVHRGTLFAQPFDDDSLEPRGSPAQVADRIATWGPALASFSVARDGTVAYVNQVPAPPHQFVWYDRGGKELSRVGAPGPWTAMALSPREDRIALQDSGDQYPQIWIMETRRGTLTRLTSEDRWNAFPRFSPDGTLLAWSCAVETPPNPFVMNIDGTGEPRRLLYSSLQAHPMSWSPDGKWIVYVIAKGAGFDLGMVPAAGGQLRTLIGTNFTEYSGRVSPDGRWLAYESDESGQREIYVTTFPEPRGKWRISTSGGVLPMWNPARPELIYREPQSGRLMSVRIGEGSTPEPETPQPLFSSDHGDFAISRDGQRILVNQQVGAREAPPIMIVKHWQPEASR